MDNLSDDWLLAKLEAVAKDAYRRGLDEPEMTKVISEAVSKSLPSMAKDLAGSLRKGMHSTLSENRYIHSEFQSRLLYRWFEGIDLLEVVILVLADIGEEINDILRSDPNKANAYLAEVVTRFHARSVRIAREVLCLIKNGFADGALARWRSMHEIAVLGFFIVEHGNETAKLYLDYSEIDRYEEFVSFQKHAHALGHEEISKENEKAIIDKRNDLISQYSKEFALPYGWACKNLSKDKRNFAGIEESIGLDHMRPFYKIASRSIHSTPKGLFWDMGMHDQSHVSLLLAGETNYGFADPAQNAAISLLQATSSLFILKPSVTRLVSLKAVELLINEMSQRLVETQQLIESEEGGKNPESG